jgi:uncharacterized coiled-coil DUF342 family protein
MKILNIFLSILILLLAVASAVFSYFLYEKRTQLVSGWEKMAQAVNSSAVNLDKGSGTEVAKELSKENLGHDKYDELDKRLPKLGEHTTKIISERDELANALRKIGQTSEVDNLQSLDKFKELASYKTNADAVVAKVNSNTRQQTATLNKICNTASKIGVDLRISALKGSSYSSELGKLDSKISMVKRRISDSDRQFKTIYSVTGGTSPLNFSDSAYKGSINKVVSSVRDLRKKYDRSQSSLRSKGNLVSNLKNTVKQRDGRIDGLNKLMKKKIVEIQRLNRIITGATDSKVIDPWEDGSTEARRALQGKIIKVDRKYGFVVVDIGKNTKIKQAIGTKTNYAYPMIPVKSKMIVARDIDSSDGEYIGEIELVKINDECSIANVISTAKGKGVAVGDTVFFSSSQIKAMGKK